MDEWFNKKRCDRCGASLEGGFTMSRFATSALCMKCAEEECQHPDYQLATDIELAAVRSHRLILPFLPGQPMPAPLVRLLQQFTANLVRLLQIFLHFSTEVLY